jgi:hypothetical protein
VLVGWITDRELLRSFLPGDIMMLPNTSVGFILTGASLWLQRSEHPTLGERRVARALAYAVLALGVLSRRWPSPTRWVRQPS